MMLREVSSIKSQLYMLVPGKVDMHMKDKFEQNILCCYGVMSILLTANGWTDMDTVSDYSAHLRAEQ